jgi:hypothetical protein
VLHTEQTRCEASGLLLRADKSKSHVLNNGGITRLNEVILYVTFKHDITLNSEIIARLRVQSNIHGCVL